jgi:high affinity sulfate transporter 1
MAVTTQKQEKPGLLGRYAPILHWLPKYQMKWLSGDLIAGLSVWALMVPQALGYAEVAGVPSQYGLYAAFAGLLFYAIFGSSRHVITGPSSTVAAVTGAAVLSVASSGSDEAIALAAAIALFAGIIYLILGIFRMGWVSNFLAASVLAGFIGGIAIDVAIGQLDNLFGITVADGNSWQELLWSIQALPTLNVTATVIGLSSLAILFALRKWAPKIPGALVVVVLGILAVVIFNLQEVIDIVGDVPTGMPSIGLPAITLDQVPIAIIGAVGVVLVGFSETLAAGRLYASKYHYDVSTNQEMIAEGAANAGSGLLSGFGVTGSLSKSGANDSAGAKTEMASLFQSFLVLLTMLFLAALFTDLPQAVLGAIVIAAVLPLIEMEEFKRLWRVQRAEFWLAMAALVGVLTFGTLQGVIIGVGISLFLLIARASRPYIPVLGRKPDHEVYHHLSDYPDYKTEPGIAVIRFEGDLYFATANALRERIRELVVDVDPPVKDIVIDMVAVSVTDIEGADMIRTVTEEMGRDGIQIHLAQVHKSVFDFLKEDGIGEVLGPEYVHEDVFAAVEAIKQSRTSSEG